MSGGELATGGWAHRKWADWDRTAGLIIDKLYKISSGLKNWACLVGKLKRQGGSLNRPKKKARGWRQRRQGRTRHVRTYLLTQSLTQRPHSGPALVPRFDPELLLPQRSEDTFAKTFASFGSKNSRHPDLDPDSLPIMSHDDTTVPLLQRTQQQHHLIFYRRLSFPHPGTCLTPVVASQLVGVTVSVSVRQ